MLGYIIILSVPAPKTGLHLLSYMLYTDQPPMNTAAVMHNWIWSGLRSGAVAGSGSVLAMAWLIWAIKNAIKNPVV